MKYLKVKISISGQSNGANVDYGTRQRDIEMSADYDEEKMYEALHAAIIHEEDTDK